MLTKLIVFLEKNRRRSKTTIRLCYKLYGWRYACIDGLFENKNLYQ